MDTFTKRDLLRLLDEKKGPLASLYLPTARAGEEGQQARIRLKNLAIRLEDELRTYGLRAPDAKEYLAPVLDLVDNTTFWKSQSDGIAVFRSSASFATYRLDCAFPEVAVVGPRFHIRPLLPLIEGEGHYWILAVSQKSCRLLEATRTTVSGCVVPGMPTSLDDALGYTDLKQRFHKSDRQGIGGPQPNVYRGKGALVEIRQQDVRKYLQLIDKAVHPYLGGSRSPLVGAMLEQYFPIFSEVCSYPHLLPQPLGGNPELISDQELRQRSWPLVQPIFTQAKAQALDWYWKWAHEDKATADVQEVVAAAREGRVHTLMIRAGAELRGDIDARTGRPRLHLDVSRGSEDLIDLAAAETLRGGGEVYTYATDQFPGDGPLAALLRYPSPLAAGGTI